MSIRRFATRTLGVAGLATALAASPAGTAYAAGATNVQGLLRPDDGHVCTARPQALFANTVEGSLVGCWYVDTAEYKHANDNGNFIATGTETFLGCLSTRCGAFHTTYTFTAKYDGDHEEHGRCHHPVVSGEGGFAGVTGEINMHDLPKGCATYKGTLKLAG
jgi:hypothetical protein